MTQSQSTDSDANRFRSRLKPYAVGVGAVLALLLAIWIPPLLVEQFSFAMLFSRSPVAETISGVLDVLTSRLARSIWALGLIALFVRRYDLAEALREQRSLVRTVAAGAGLLIAFTVSFQLIDTVTDILMGSLYRDSVVGALLFVIDIDDELTRLIAFGVAFYTSLSRGHSVAGHRETYLLTYLTVAVLSVLGNVSHLLQDVIYGETLKGVGDVLGVFIRDLLVSSLWMTVLAGTFAIVFAYGIERYGATGIGHGRTAVADGGEP